MYRDEVPAYGALIDLVETVNKSTRQDAATRNEGIAVTAQDDLARISEERHGAIRLGTAEELSMMRRIFAVMGMYPVGYYDLSVAGIPVHSTAFRPIDAAALQRNPFRIFTSLLRIELIEDSDLREVAECILKNRNIFSDRLRALLERVEAEGVLPEDESEEFITFAVQVFKWHPDTCVELSLHERFQSEHRLVADVVSFQGPHINHLTPRTLDIDAVQARMPGFGINPKAIIEGPPARRCPILLRQTSFKAMEEPVRFVGKDGKTVLGSHAARFGEVEQRGVALTPMGRALYDRLLAEVRARIFPSADGANAEEYKTVLRDTFRSFPDTWNELHDQGLAYFRYNVAREVHCGEGIALSVGALIEGGFITYEPMTYEDFLPVSAAGIFQSNLGNEVSMEIASQSSKDAFERFLGCQVHDEFALYEKAQSDSLEACLAGLRNAA